MRGDLTKKLECKKEGTRGSSSPGRTAQTSKQNHAPQQQAARQNAIITVGAVGRNRGSALALKDSVARHTLGAAGSRPPVKHHDQIEDAQGLGRRGTAARSKQVAACSRGSGDAQQGLTGACHLQRQRLVEIGGGSSAARPAATGATKRRALSSAKTTGQPGRRGSEGVLPVRQRFHAVDRDRLGSLRSKRQPGPSPWWGRAQGSSGEACAPARPRQR